MAREVEAPRTRKFRVTGIFYSGFDEYDRRLMYTALGDTQALIGRGDQVMGVEMKVKDVDRAPRRSAEQLQQRARRAAVSRSRTGTSSTTTCSRR